MIAIAFVKLSGTRSLSLAPLCARERGIAAVRTNPDPSRERSDRVSGFRVRIIVKESHATS
jgi:hypothetical protein